MIRINGKDVASTINTPTDTPMGTYHLASNPNLYEVQRTNNFEFVVTGLDGILKAGAIGDESTATIGNAQEVLRMSVLSSTVPHFSQTPIEVKRGNSTIKFAGVPDFGAGTLVLNDFIGADTKAVCMAWQNLSYNARTQKVGLASDYKKEAYLIEYTPDNQKVRQFKLYGCWISNLTESDHSFETNDKSQITLEIQYDHAEIDMSDVL